MVLTYHDLNCSGASPTTEIVFEFCLTAVILTGDMSSAVPKRGCSKRGRTQKHANERTRAQMCTKERKRKSAKGRKRAQKSASA